MLKSPLNSPVSKWDHFAGAHQAAGDRQQPPRLARAHHQRDLLGLTEVLDLGGEVQPSERYAKVDRDLHEGSFPGAAADHTS